MSRAIARHRRAFLRLILAAATVPVVSRRALAAGAPYAP